MIRTDANAWRVVQKSENKSGEILIAVDWTCPECRENMEEDVVFLCADELSSIQEQSNFVIIRNCECCHERMAILCRGRIPW